MAGRRFLRPRWRNLSAILILALGLLALSCTPFAWPGLAPPASPSPTPRAIPSPTASPTATVPKPQAEAVKKLQGSTLPRRDLYQLGRRLKGLDRIPSIPARSHSLGDEEEFWMVDYPTDSYRYLTATLRYMSPHAFFWVQKDHPVASEALEEAAATLEEKILPTLKELLGWEPAPGMDEDTSLHIVHMDLSGPLVGYFSSIDAHPRALHPYSNERQAVYLNLEFLRPAERLYYAVLSHELAHLAQGDINPGQETWLNEGLAELASKVAGYGLRETFLYTSAEQVDVQLTTWGRKSEDPARHYELSFLFCEYIWERLGVEGIRQLARIPAQVPQALNSAFASEGLDFDGFFGQWVLANWMDERYEDAHEVYSYRDLAVYLSAEISACCPLESSGRVHQYAADYIELELESERPLTFTVNFQGEISVTVLPTHPHSGQRFWWSNRGDVIDTSLTRPLDLTGLSQATLSFWAWFDLEENFDYAYVEISTDGGASWHILTGTHSTLTNPSGNSFGPGFNGKSGNGDEPKWVKEEMDLSAYSGQEILVRFEVVTDDGVNGQGLALDDISIPELRYVDACEEWGEWRPSGFLLTDNLLPQRFRVWLVEELGRPVVSEMELDQNQTGQLQVELPAGSRGSITLVVAALTPFTTLPAHYRYQVLPARP